MTEVEMAEPQHEPGGGEGSDETLPPGIDEPGGEQPEADALEQQLLPDSGELSQQVESYQEEPLHESSGSAFGADDADMIEQGRIEPSEDDYRE